jgi:peptidyl-prolyl cis-trans isomerase B (cyclophilin B)
MNIRKLSIILIIFLIAISLIICGESDNGEEEMSNFEKMSPEELKDYKAVIKTDFGDIHLEFFPEAAPNHVRNFLKLANSDFYDGTTFHRVIPGFMIQGGDPNSKDDDPTNDGQGGPGYTIDAEFSEISHKRGILSMARSPQGPNTAGSQFFIVHQTAAHLDGQYSVFGRVTDGLNVVDKIANVKTGARDRPIEDVKVNIDVMKK